MSHQPLSLRFTWQSLILWIGLNVAGYILGADLHYQGGGPPTSFNPPDIDPSASLVGFVFGAISGLIIASLQWVVLKRVIPQARLWIPFNIVGFGLVHALNDSVPYLPIPMPLLLLVGGLMVGLGQSLALRHVLSGTLWILLVAGTWLLSFQLGFTMLALVAGNPIMELILGGGVTGLVTGIITGTALMVMLAEETRQPTNPFRQKNSRWATTSPTKKAIWVGVLAVIAVVFLILAGMMLGFI